VSLPTTAAIQVDRPTTILDALALVSDLSRLERGNGTATAVNPGGLRYDRHE
jgi:hypothetical protein